MRIASAISIALVRRRLRPGDVERWAAELDAVAADLRRLYAARGAGDTK